MDGGQPFVTDEGNRIVDCRRDDWSDPQRLAAEVDAVPGVVAHGLFLDMASIAFVATAQGVRVIEAPPDAAP
jgi:ribose 5-phosphate isomerase A